MAANPQIRIIKRKIKCESEMGNDRNNEPSLLFLDYIANVVLMPTKVKKRKKKTT